MKVFISWSGQHSKKLGEALRDWLPTVLQLVEPYFTPSDIEKGTLWSTDIAKQLSESQIGILCVTRENIHSDWILFEAGALSKSLEKSHVCPLLFAISNTDLSGPLKQFQTTEFHKEDMHRLINVINGRLGEKKLPQKTLDTVFQKWWPDLEEKVKNILGEIDEIDEPLRSDRELLEEILQLSRVAARRLRAPTRISPRAIEKLLSGYISLHDQQVNKVGNYQDTLDALKEMHKPVLYISEKYKGYSEQIDDLILKLRNLTYVVENDGEDKDIPDDVPF